MHSVPKPLRSIVIAAAIGLAGGPASAQTGLNAEAVASRADDWLKSFEAAGDFSGVTLLAQGDKILFQKAYGYADPQVHSPNRIETRFRVASLSKTFTAAAIEQLVAEGKIRYSDVLSRFVAGVVNGDSITIEQLLTHESGVGVLDSEDLYRECPSHDDLLQRLASTRPLFAPGARSQYSNEGYFLLAAIIERVSGETYGGFLRKRLFVPLHMENSGTACRDLPDDRNAYGSVATSSEAHLRPLPFNEAALDGAGTVYSTAEDLLRWLRAVDDNSAFSVGHLKYPYGWGKRHYGTRDLIEQSGRLEGFNAHMALYLKEHIYAVVVSNIQSGFLNRIPHDLEAALFGGKASQPPVLQPLPLGQRSMSQYVGTYRSSETPYPQTLEVRDGGLMMHWGTGPFWREMAMTDGDTFFVRAEYAQVRFERDREGGVRRMVWNWPGGAHLSFEKEVAKPGP